MKPWYRILIIVIGSAFAQIFFPWWSGVLVAAMVELVFGNQKFLSFLIGFYGLALPWMVQAAVIDIQNSALLSDRVMGIFSMPGWPGLAIIVTGLVAGIAGGFASWAGGHLHWIFKNESEG